MVQSSPRPSSSITLADGFLKRSKNRLLEAFVAIGVTPIELPKALLPIPFGTDFAEFQQDAMLRRAAD